MRKKGGKQLRVMEEMMMTKVRFGTPDTFRNPTTPLPSWKLYENPFYSNRHCQRRQHSSHHLPLSARKLAASLWDLTFFHLNSSMDSLDEASSFCVSHRRVSVVQSDLDLARARIQDLKAEVEFERRLRKKAECLNKRLAKELGEERKGREAMKCVCQELASEIAADKTEIERMKKEMEEERKMLRLAEVWREERVQMKLTEAKLLMEEKLAETSKDKDIDLEQTQNSNKKIQFQQRNASEEEEIQEKGGNDILRMPDLTLVTCDNPSNNNLRTINQRRTSPEAENPHIMRGIKGFVEFPRVVRAVGSRGRQSGSKVECQKAQLRLLLRHKSSAGGLNVTSSGGVLVG
ncbi:protein BRANCHLESS TRICHOME [Aristolochia californica]|uniref:protein BRANCHLESS TRICHOME n=1 Tax=Aristolochia californica TaxID=171875 RepID=UPI0035E3868C